MKEKRDEVDEWEPRYGNDSRPWLLGFSEAEPLSTTTKQTFSGDWPPSPAKEGVRKQQLRKALWDEIRREVTEELNQAEQPPLTITEYNESFIKEGFTPHPIKTNPELHRQYPLYGPALGAGSMSIWQERYPLLPGITGVPSITRSFHRSAAFTKPLDQVYDDNNILSR